MRRSPADDMLVHLRETLESDQLAALALHTGDAPAGTPSADAASALLAELRTRSRWLLVFDNAETPDALAPFLPGGPGHVLITSRNPHWTSYAVPLDVATLSLAESVALLRAQGAVLTDADADHIATNLDDLPLALAQAAALLTRGLSSVDLREELAANLVEVLAQGHPSGYPAALAAQVRLTRTRLEADHPGAAAVVAALALLAPEPFPLTTCAGRLPDQASPLLRGRRVRGWRWRGWWRRLPGMVWPVSRAARSSCTASPGTFSKER
ncbi:hypothetical protein [Streptomyces sp. S.PB5]|uniref:hypothetical protein n=1 Tax=Streptomyces sp. S.PB5 TaxID=3020844 RepID=UPI0025AFFFFD|nr:hypothetical protein [Streptomyces sp. S.PB5]MDN3028406.1 hypothetical protein [Streptomyces sp. S.PB5]